MIHTFARAFRQDLATDLSVTLDKDLPEVTGYKVAKTDVMQQAIAAYNQREFDACLARQLERLSV